MIADLLILVFILLMAALGYALVRRRNAAAKRDRRWHELANEMSGDAGGMPRPDAWRGTSGRR